METNILLLKIEDSPTIVVALVPTVFSAQVIGSEQTGLD